MLGKRGRGRDYGITRLRMEKVFSWEHFWRRRRFGEESVKKIRGKEKRDM